MLFLFLKMFVLLLAASVFSSILTWMLMRSRYTEVTETYRSWSEMDERLSGLDAKISALGGPTEVDLSGVFSRLDTVDRRVAAIDIPSTDLAPVHTGIAALSSKVGPTDLSPVLERLAALEKRVAGIPSVDLEPLHAHVRTVERKVDAIEIPGNDFSGVTSGIAALSSTVAAMRTPDLEPIAQRLAAVDDKVSQLHNTPACDLEPMHGHLRQVEAKLDGMNTGNEVDQVALERLHAHMRLLETRIGELKDGNDLTGVTSGIAALSSTVSALNNTDLAPVQQRLAVVDEKVSKLKNAVPVDLSGFKALNLRLDAIEGMLKPAAPPKFDDLTKVEGIGPKIKELLWADGITSFADLAAAPTDRLQDVLDRAGKRFQVHNPKTWAAQSAMARDDRWEDLKKWQDELDGGR